MNKRFVVWTSETSAEYIRAFSVVEEDDTVSFLNLKGETVRQFKKNDIKEYHEVKL